MLVFHHAQRIFLGQTWSIHHISPFADPVKTDTLITSISDNLVAQWLSLDEGDRKGGISEADTSDKTNHATVHDSSVEMNANAGDRVGEPPEDVTKHPSKRPRVEPIEKMKHLMVRASVQDSVTATVVFCHADWDDSCTKINRFTYCLVRGSKSSYKDIFAWMEQLCGNSITRVPVDLSETFMTGVLYEWMTTPGRNRRGSSVEFKFIPPMSVQGKGVDDISCTFSQSSVYDQCRSFKLEPGESKGQQLLRFVHHHGQQQMKLRLDLFPLQQVTWEAAALASSGHCKLKCGKSLTLVLGALQTYVLVCERV